MKRPKNNKDLIIDITLLAGDILYIPPYYPHEGITVEDSISLSIAWRGLGPASFIPKSVISLIESPSRSRFIQNSTKLFIDESSAKESIRNWQKDSLDILPSQLHNELKPKVNKTIEDHIFKLFYRYCNS